MVIASIRPSTLDGIKQLAKKVRRERQITHTLALDEASRQAGFENFQHARHSLVLQGDVPRAHPAHLVCLTAHWRAARPKDGESWPEGPRAGRELLVVRLSRPLSEIVAKHRIPHARGLQTFRLEYADHLEHVTDVVGREAARRMLLTAQRSLLFMEATGLQPVTRQEHRELLRELQRLPGRDHVSEWFAPGTDRCLLLDEPYARAVEGQEAARSSWLSERGLYSIAPHWEGIYYPGETSPRLVGRDAGFLEAAAEALANVDPVIAPEPWPHETGPYQEVYKSGLRGADGKSPRPRPGPSWRSHMGATPYGGVPGIPSRWRPTDPMPIDLHKELGPLMQKLGSGFSWRVSQMLSSVRSQLEDWSLMEHKHSDDEGLYNLYYGGPGSALCDSDEDRLVALRLAKAIVQRGYADCKPKREVMAALDAAIAEVSPRPGR
ncbi:DUF5623 domain-containing protein [Stenotrophomonas geniculata]|uniref:DUF5623 domain-containing protein n=1 Tax=Stenotrophomonas geniculata TaxID=86188 RepID=UPI002E79FA90|nr:DUF5623 domain-containing protein [Stenotrophomonas geniculata]